MSQLSEFDGKCIDGLEFCKKAYSLLEEIRTTETGISNLRMRASDLEKKLLEEILPICKYVQNSYRAGRYISICWVDGNQQYDAKVSENGFYIDQGFYPEESYIEVTCSVHPLDYLAREKLENDGFCYGYDGLSRNKDRSIESAATSYSGLSFIEQDAELVVKAITKKLGKNYPENTVLIVQSKLSTVYAKSEWVRLIEYVQGKVTSFPFKEVLITDSNHVYTSKVYSHEGP